MGELMTTDKTDSPDLLLLGRPVEGGQEVVRFRKGHVPEIAVAMPLEEGQQTFNEVVNVTPVPGSSLYEARTLSVPPVKSHAGPSRVSSPKYRDHWDHIFKGTDTESIN